MKNVSEYEIKLGKEWVLALDKTFKKKNKETKIAGFRKGCAPKEVYLKKVGLESLYMDSINDCVDIAYKKLIKENQIKPIIEPTVDVTGISDTNVIFKFTIITKPEVVLGNYKDLKIPKEKVTVSEKEIDEEIERLREKTAEMIIKEKGKVAKGDTAIINFNGFVDGAPLEGGQGENYPLEIGSHTFIPGFEEGLIGMSPLEEKELKLKFPENYLENLKNKEVVFKVKINEIKTRKLPTINKAFFKDLGYDDVKDEQSFRKKIKENLVHDKKNIAEDKFIDLCLAKAAANMKVEINPEIIQEEVKRMLEQFTNQLKNQGMNIDTYYEMTHSKKEDLTNQMSPEALKRIKYRYLLEAIAEKEKIDFTEEEVKTKAEEMAKNYGITVEELIKDFGTLDIVKYDMKMHQALEILKDNN